MSQGDLLPAGGAAELQGACFVKRTHGQMAKVDREVKADAVCEQCGEGKAVALCRQCAELICCEYERSHKKMKVFSGDALASLEDEGDEHDQVMKIFCFDCNQVIRGDYTITDHSGHKFNFLNECARESRRTLRESLTPLRKVQGDIARAEDSLVAEEDKIDDQKNEVCKSIEDSIDNLKALLDQRKAELVKKATTLAQEKKDKLSVQKRGFGIAQTEIQLLVDVIERNIESTSDQDLMSIQTQLKAQIEEEEKRQGQLSLELTAIAGVACKPPSTNTLSDDLGSVFTQPTPALLHGIESCEVGSVMDVCVFAPTATLCDISAELKCVANPSSSLQGDVVQKGVGIYSICLTPQARGRHDLTVRIKDKESTGSPFRVFVTIPPSQLGQNVRKIGGVLSWGIAINDRQQLVVTRSGASENVVIMQRDGKVVQTIEHDNFKYLHGVATGADGSIYVTDDGVQCLFKFNREGTLIKTVSDELKECYTVKIIQNRLYVFCCTECLIKIFDTDCNVIGTIQTKECPNPADIAEGPDGLYVAGNKSICVYSPINGAFVRQLNLQPSSLELSEFNGICFDSTGHIIASDNDNGVYIFKPSGEFVRKIDSHFERPTGIAIDEDGYVYVCDCDKEEVVVL